MDSNLEKIEELFEEGNLYVEEGRLEEGEAILQEVLRIQPEHASALNKLGVIWALRKEQEKAREYFQQELEVNEKFFPALTNLGNIYLEQDELGKAQEYYEAALLYNPDYGPPHNNLAVVHKKKGDLNKMVGSLKRAKKAGTLTIDASKEKSLLFNPGCIVFLVMVFLVLIIYFIILR